MPFTAGKNQVFWLDNAAGTLVNLSTFVTDVDFPREADAEEVTTLGQGAKVYVVTLTDATISFNGKWDGAASAVDEVLAGILGHATSKTFEYGPGGSTGGAVKYTGEAWLTKYQTKGAVGGVVEFSGELQCSGTITRTTW